jgi:DNA-directed RNA polymerase subunit RPC12/RpoP
MTCQNCDDTKFIDVRKPYKKMYELGMGKYIPLNILCPSCAKEYRCEKCNSKNTELLFAKIVLSEDSNYTVIKCKDCGNKNK